MLLGFTANNNTIMGLLQFVQRTLGFGRTAPPPLVGLRAPALVAPKARPAVATPRPAPDTLGLGTLLLREEMLDHRGRLAGHRIGLRASASPQDYLQALQSSQVQRQAERRWVLIDLPTAMATAWIDGDWRSLVQEHTVFQLRPAPSLHDTMVAMKAQGAGVALAWTGDTPEPTEHWALASHAILSLRQTPLEEVERRMQHLRQHHPALQIVVQDVETWAEQRLCVAQGAMLVMGAFLSTADNHVRNEALPPGRLCLMEMLQALRQDADTAVMADLAKHDPGVAVQLLSMVNSPAFGLAQPLSSLEQALTMLGREALYRWLSVSLFKGGEDRPHDLALLEMALTRARFMEQLGLEHGAPGQADELFLVGLLSYVDRLLGLPLADVLSRMSAPQTVTDVLLLSQGPHAPWLLLAMAMEHCDADRVMRIAQAQGLPAGHFTRARDEAVLWAADAVH